MDFRYSCIVKVVLPRRILLSDPFSMEEVLEKNGILW